VMTGEIAPGRYTKPGAKGARLSKGEWMGTAWE